MYDISDILDAFQHPYKFVRELNLLYHRRFRLHDYNHSGFDIFAEDWDNLVILDACRYDEFERLWDGPGRLEHRISRGSSTNEYVRGNFRGRERLDTVCVTANGWYMQVDGVELHDIVPVIDEQYRDESTGTVPPDQVTEVAKQAAQEYPKKKLVVHYVQPHAAYLGPTGREYFDGIVTRDDIHARKQSDTPFHSDKLRTAYRENLELVIEEVESLLDTIAGKTVVSADHGEMLGDRHFPIPMRDYMHPHGIDNEVLVKVPWLVCSGDNRRPIVAEKPERTQESADTETVKEHLEQLGYFR